MRSMFALIVIALMLSAARGAGPTLEELQEQQIVLLKRENRRLERDLERERRDRIVYETQLEVAALRGFRVNDLVRQAPLTRERLIRLVDESLDRQFPGRSLQRYVRMHQLFGALPEPFDLRAVMHGLVREQAGGIYDPHTGEFLVNPGFPIEKALGRVILAHEITHALQDQNYDLLGMGLEDPNAGDRATALLCIVEGDATLLMAEHMARTSEPMDLLTDGLTSLAGVSQEQLNGAPAAIREMMFFPYTGGSAFFNALQGRTPGGGPPPVTEDGLLAPSWRNAVFRNPPVSTEQIIHPEKYLAGEGPGELPAPPPFDEEGADVTTLGEFGMRLLLDATLGRPRARAAAAGWNGDRMILSDAAGGGLDVHWTMRWDTPADADEAIRSLVDAFGARTGAQADAPQPERPAALEGNGLRAAITRPGRDLVVLELRAEPLALR